MGRQSDDSEPSVSRRAVLAATAGLVGLAGCSGGGDGGGSAAETTTDLVGGGTTERDRTATGGGADSTPAGDASIEACPMLPGSMTGYDPGSDPLPVRFEYPGAMQGSLTYVSDRNWEDGNAIVGTIQRGSEQEGDGDIALTVGVDYFARYADGRDAWYEKRSSMETFTSTEFDGESVTFLTGETAGPYGGEHNGHNAVGLIPFDLSEPAKRGYFRAILGIETLLYRADVNDVTEDCGKNQTAALKRVVESLSRNPATTFEEYVDP